MKITSYLFTALSLFSCASGIKKENIDLKEKKVTKLELQSILDKEKLEGTILIYDLENQTYYSNNFESAEKQVIPASTFKIPNSLIALELGIIENEKTVIPWDGQERSIGAWNQDLTFKNAFHYSCVPCYQNIARQVGVERMDSMLQLFNFGEPDVSEGNIDMFWLEGKTKISPVEQIDFLRRFEASELGISERTDKISKEMMVVKDGSNFREIGKTGLSLSGVGWYVGYIRKEANVYFFATRLAMNENKNYNLRKEVTYKALEDLLILTN